MTVLCLLNMQLFGFVTMKKKSKQATHVGANSCGNGTERKLQLADSTAR